MAGAPVPGYLKWRVLHPVSGAVVIDPLPNPHQSRFEVWAPQAGMPATTAIGSFAIPLFPPGSDQYRWAKADYDQLKYGQRVEAYLTARPSDPYGAIGDPKFTGVITLLPQDLATYAIQGSDSIWLASKAMTGRTDLFDSTTDNLLKYGLKAQQVLFLDGDPAVWTLGSFTNTGAWTTATDEGFQTIATAINTGDGLITTTTSFTNGQYADCAVEASYRVTTDTAASAYSEAGVVAAYTDTNNFVLGRAVSTQVTSTSWAVTAEIFQKSGGVYTQKAGTPVFPLSTSAARIQPRLIGVQLTATSYQWRLLVNGIDTNCVWFQTVAAGQPTGPIGLRSFKAGNALSETANCAQLVFMNKAQIFQYGSISAGSRTVTQVLSSMPSLELWNMAATVENFAWRKNPKAGLNQDTVDYGASPGTDRSTSVIFREGENLVTATVDPNAEQLASAVTVAGASGPDGSGQLNWYNKTQIDNMGLVIDAASAPNVSDQGALRAYGARILANRAAPGSSVKLTVQRDPDTVDQWRELDTIGVHSPRLYLQNRSYQVLGYNFQEGSPTQEITLVQYASDRLTSEHRLYQAIKTMLLGMHEIRQVP